MLARCRKIFALITLLTGCFHAGNVLALGLGELTVNSSLNEPLDATIQVLGLEGLNEGQIDVQLGSLADFQRANIERIGLIDDIAIEVIIFNAEQGVLLLTSEDRVVEPFLNMVISVRWPNGRLMRSYTALIDLPLFTSNDAVVTPVQPPTTPGSTAPETEPAPQQAPQAPQIVSSSQAALPQAEPAAEPAQPPAQDIPAASTPPQETAPSVVVQSGDTLYDIAQQNRPDNSVSVEQTMLAIQRSNPNAFAGNNINSLRAGQVLRIPSVQDIRSLDQSQALNQIALQNQAAGNEPLAVNSNTGNNTTGGADELMILGGEDGAASLSGDDDLAETIAALENQLALSEENLDRARLENQELRSRYAELEEQIEILQNIIAMQDERLAQLQADLAAQAAETPAQTAAAQTQPVSSLPPPPVDNSLMGKISAMFENTIVLASSLVALILLVVGFLVWRRQAAQSELDDFDLGGTAVAGAPSRFEDEESFSDHDSAGGFLAGLKAKFSRHDDGDDYEESEAPSSVAAADPQDDDTDDINDGENETFFDAADDNDSGESDSQAAGTETDLDDYDDDDVDEDDESGLLAKVRGFFSRTSSRDEEDDEDFFEDNFDDDADDDADDLNDDVNDDVNDDDEAFDEGLDDEEPEQQGAVVVDEDDSEEESAFVIDDDAFESGDAEEIVLDDDDLLKDEFALDTTAELDTTDNEDVGTETDDDVLAIDDSGLDDNVLVLPDDNEEVLEIGLENEADDTALDTFEFGLNDDEVDDTAATGNDGLEEAEENIEAFDFSLDDTPAAADADETNGEDNKDVESFEFKVDDTPVVADTPDEDAEAVETFEFDVSAVSSFEEDAAEPEQSQEDVETFDFDTASSAEAVDPLDAALDEIDAETAEASSDSGTDDDDDFDFGTIDIDDSLFDDDDEDAESADLPQRDESSTKLDLAVAYEAMGDIEGAKEILNEVLAEGNDTQKVEAKKLLEKWEQS